MSEFRHRLHPAQVLDLSERTPEAALKWCVMVAPRMCKILVAGGDGTVAWINNTIHKMQLDVSMIKCLVLMNFQFQTLIVES